MPQKCVFFLIKLRQLPNEEQAECVFHHTNVCGGCCSADGQLNKIILPKNISVWFVLWGLALFWGSHQARKICFGIRYINHVHFLFFGMCECSHPYLFCWCKPKQASSFVIWNAVMFFDVASQWKAEQDYIHVSLLNKSLTQYGTEDDWHFYNNTVL